MSSSIELSFRFTQHRYDDVAVNGSASVAKLAAASHRTRFNMASSRDLVLALLNVTLGTDGPLSVDTRSNAALALSVLMQEPTGQRNLLSVAKIADDDSRLRVLLSLCKSTVAQTLGCLEHESLCLRMYWYVCTQKALTLLIVICLNVCLLSFILFFIDPA